MWTLTLCFILSFEAYPAKGRIISGSVEKKNQTNLCNKSGRNFWLFSHTHFLCWHTESVETVSVKCSDFFFVVRVRKRLHALQAGGGGGGDPRRSVGRRGYALHRLVLGAWPPVRVLGLGTESLQPLQLVGDRNCRARLATEKVARFVASRYWQKHVTKTIWKVARFSEKCVKLATHDPWVWSSSCSSTASHKSHQQHCFHPSVGLRNNRISKKAGNGPALSCSSW